MFNFKAPMAGKVFKKMNQMTQKQAYTYGAIAIVALVALLTLASVAGNGKDDSFDDLQGRGYDLAQMPFLNDEAEQFLLSSKYPDMKNNNISALYSKEEKAARQQEDAQREAEAAEEEAEAAASSGISSGRGYTGRRGRTAAPRTPTQIGAFSPSGSMASASGGNTSATYGGTVKGDFSAFQRQDKGKEAPFVDPNNARQALSRFNAASRAAARGANKARDSQRALFGSKVDGTGAYMDSSGGVPLSGTGGINYEEAQTADLSNLDETMQQRATEARDKARAQQLQEEDSLFDMFLEGLMQIGLDVAKRAISNGLDNLMSGIQANNYAKKTFGAGKSDLTAGSMVPEGWTQGGKVTNPVYTQSNWVTQGDDGKWYITQAGENYFQNNINNHTGSGRNIFSQGLDETPGIKLGKTSNKDEVKNGAASGQKGKNDEGNNK